MNEDAKLNNFLKERLEADVPGDPPRLEAILQAASAAAQARPAARRRSVRLWDGLLVAASLAVLCLFAVHLWTSSPSASSPSQLSQASSPVPTSSPSDAPSPEQTVVDAIDLLSTFDGEEAKHRQRRRVQQTAPEANGPPPRGYTGLRSRRSRM